MMAKTKKIVEKVDSHMRKMSAGKAVARHGKCSVKATRPEQVIPLEEEFKDF